MMSSRDATEEQDASAVPLIKITDATPHKTSIAPLAALSTPTSTPAPDAHTPGSSGKGIGDAAYRLLYRGALSLPDSYLQLDGLAFSARLANRHGQASVPQDSPSCSRARSNEVSARELMSNPLALALESMRGRQSLRFKGTVRLQDVWMDDTGEVYMDIHPFATLSKIYFEQILCLSPLVAPLHDTSGLKRTDIGVRVSLGDTDGPETTDIVIYGETSTWLHPPPLQLSPAATSTSVGPPPLSVRVARITPTPRAPRPDDPTPRQPPAHVFGGLTIGDLGAHKRIVARPVAGRARERDKDKDKDKGEDHVLRRAREVMLHLPRSKVPAGGNANGKDTLKDKRAEEQSRRDTVFRVPELPAKVRRRQGETGTDVFGAIGPPQPPSANGKGKVKTVRDGGVGETSSSSAIEDANKLMLKRLAVHRLAESGIPRSHAEFKDVFGFVYRGAAFALRSQLKVVHISVHAAETVVEAHVKMYVVTLGDTSGLRESSLSDAMDAAGG